MAKRSADQKLVRMTNQNLILSTIREKESVTRSILSKALQLSVPSVCANVDQLIELGIVRETGEETSSVGRKAKVLKLNPRYGYLISVDLSNPCVTLAMSDLEPVVLQQLKFDLDLYRIEQLMELLLEKIEQLLEQSSISSRQVLAISVSVPGIVDSERGVVECGSYLASLGSVAFREQLQSRFDVPVLLQKDIDAAIIAERNFGAAKDSANAAFVSADVGIGTGIVLGGALFKGSRYAAGELSRFIMDRQPLADGLAPALLGDLVSVKALVQSVRAEVELGAASSVLDEAGGDSARIDFNAIIGATMSGDPLCVKHVKESARLMGLAVSNMLLLLDLDCVILGGGFAALGAAYTENLAEEVRKHVPQTPSIRTTELRSKAVVMGGISLALEAVFDELLLEKSV
ncbi:ROK family transcriptional regulator [Cohnella phaseoli]|uniref:MarR family transcriptional regulator n=1 Tax=Cohnella phaseoli TaxID=456490 RepID=A0A3D9KJE2_9BACL|nr:ROK family protein [Cohnella phaseoli]RED86555.1 MarR family transcriptional regulator [Cohnella phaseoli]